MATLGTEESGCYKGVVVVERWPLVQVGQVGQLLEDDLIVPLSIGQVIFKSYCPARSSTCHRLFQERH